CHLASLPSEVRWNELPLVPRFINTTTFVASIFGSGEARRGSIPRSGAVTEEQRSQNRKATQPSGRRFFLAPTSLLTPYRPLKGEWHLHKTQLAQTRNCATDMAFWPVAKFVTRRAEPRVFVSYPFDGSRHASFRSLRHQIGSQRPEQL